MYWRIYSILLLIIVVIYSCDAPRLNPLDPQNPDFIEPPIIDTTKYSIEGNIITLTAPQQPIPNVSIFWPNDNLIIWSNQSGDFILYDLEPRDGWLYFESSGYFKDSTYVE